MYTAAKCCICEKGPYPLKTLYAHMRRVHKCVEDDIAKVQHAIKKAVYDGKDEEACDVCGKVYFSSSGLRTHKRRAHRKTSKDSAEPAEKISHTVECPVCSQPFYSTLELAEHCKMQHDDGTTDFSIIVKMFDSWTDFEMWREQKELETYSKLVKRTFRKSNYWSTITYTCQHSRGSSKESLDRRKRNRRKTRLCRNCPCFAKVKHRRDEMVEVIACFGHCGHPHPAYMAVTDGERQIPSLSNNVTLDHNDLYIHSAQPPSVSAQEGIKQIPMVINDIGNVKLNDLRPSDEVESSSVEGSSHTHGSRNDKKTCDEDDEEIVVDDIPEAVNNKEQHRLQQQHQQQQLTTTARETVKAYRRFEQNLLKMGEVVQVFVEEQRYDLMNKFSDILEICMQQVPPELVNQVYFRTPSNTRTDSVPDGVEI